MRAGRLRDTAIVQRRGSTVDANGQPDTTWTVLDTVRCAVEPLNGSEYFTASGEGSSVSTRVRIRYNATIATLSPADRLVIGSTNYDIISVINPQNRSREFVLMCSVIDRGS